MSSEAAREAAEWTDGDDYVLLDDDGVPIPPEAEASCMMAMAYGDLELGQSSEWMLLHAPGPDSADDCGALVTLRATAEAVQSACDAFEKELREGAVSDDGDNGDRKEERGNSAIDGPKAPAPSTAATPPETENKDEEEEEDEEGMLECGMLGSRAFSDMGEDEEWTLEELRGRRRVKGELEYLCKWRFYAELTWEPREFLLDEGYGAQVAALDAEKDPQRPSAKPKPRRQVKPRCYTDIIDQHFPALIGEVAAKFRHAGYHIEHYASVMGGEAADRFMKRWAAAPREMPIALFHGTRQSSIRSIARNGLIIPGRAGVRVANGSAYGVGIYTALNPSISVAYARDCNLMFVCLGIVGSPRVRAVDDICVFFDEALVMPLWLVQYSRTSGGLTNPKRVTFQELMGNVDDVTPYVGGIPGRIATASSAHVAPGLDGVKVPRSVLRTGATKKMLKQQPRFIKDLYKGGMLPPRK